MAGIYVHIPFCRQACYYCDFHFSTNLAIRNELIDALKKEISLRASYLGEPVNTIYFGGGTPSLIPPSDLARLLGQINRIFKVEPGSEITLEGNPDDLNAQTLHELRAIGVNRLSIGIQSYDDAILRFLNRAHDSKAALACIPTARAAGFDNISIDLIYAIPGQDDVRWRENIRQTIAFSPEHISAYSLTIEDKTVFGNWSRRGKLSPVDEEKSATQLDILLQEMNAAGYEQYEVSNFARPGFISRHNSSYWRQQPYLGIGPSAHSYNRMSRQWNIANNHQYVDALRHERIPATIETLSREDVINDYLLTTLRTSWGADLTELHRSLGYDLVSQRGDYLKTLINEGLAVVERDRLMLTPRGRFLADKISADLFVNPRS